jgi:hypothetical protein
MPNYRDWTASEIVLQMPGARNILEKHFGPDGIGKGSGARLRELAKWKSVDLDVVLREIELVAKQTRTYT